MFLNKENNVFVENNKCSHKEFFKGKLKFCKNCVLFFPKSKKEIIENKMFLINKINPNKQYKMMIINQNINKVYKKNCQFLDYRQPIINWAKEICQKLNYCQKTINISCSNIDFIFSTYKFRSQEIKIIIIICIIISAKIIEEDYKIPNYIDIVGFLKNKYRLQEVKYYEKLIFKLADWNFNLTTTIDFMDYFLKVGVLSKLEIKCLYENIEDNNLIKLEFFEEKIIKKFKKKLNLLLNYSLNIYELNQFTNLAICCSCIAWTKKFLGFKTIWTNELIELTFLNYHQIQNIICLIEKEENINILFNKMCLNQ